MWLNSLVARSWPSSKTICSAWSTSEAVSPGRSHPRRAISPPARMSPRRIGLVDDLGVMARVRARRDERRELVDARRAADVLELPSLVQLVDERDRVDGLALRVEGERGAVDLRVALAVEVVPVRVQDLAHGGDRAGREHHRAEDGLLGVEVLGRDRSLLERLGHAVARLIRPGALGPVTSGGGNAHPQQQTPDVQPLWNGCSHTGRTVSATSAEICGERVPLGAGTSRAYPHPC
jgi:hypothetical protein